MAGADAAAVLVIVPVEDIVATVFDGPVPPVDLQYLLGVGLFRGLAGDAVGSELLMSWILRLSHIVN